MAGRDFEVLLALLVVVVTWDVVSERHRNPATLGCRRMMRLV